MSGSAPQSETYWTTTSSLLVRARRSPHSRLLEPADGSSRCGDDEHCVRYPCPRMSRAAAAVTISAAIRSGCEAFGLSHRRRPCVHRDRAVRRQAGVVRVERQVLVDCRQRHSRRRRCCASKQVQQVATWAGTTASGADPSAPKNRPLGRCCAQLQKPVRSAIDRSFSGSPKLAGLRFYRVRSRRARHRSRSPRGRRRQRQRRVNRKSARPPQKSSAVKPAEVIAC